MRFKKACSYFTISLFLHLYYFLTATSAFGQTTDLKQLEYTQQLSYQHPDSALVILKNIHAKALADNDVITEGMCLQQIGKICFIQGHYSQSLEYHQQAERIFISENRKDLQASNLNDMGKLSYYNRQKANSKDFYIKALNLYNSIGDKAGLGATFGNLGHLYEKKALYDSAFYYQHKAIEQYNQLNNHPGIAKIFENLGSIYEDLATYDSSYYYFNKALELYKSNNNEIATIEVYNNLGDVLRKTEKYAEALIKTRKALELSTKANDTYQMGSACRDIAKTFQLMHQMDSAYYYQEMNHKYLQDVYSMDESTKTSFLRVLYDMDQQKAEIAKLENNRKINHLITLSICIIIVLLVAIGSLLLSRQRLKIKDQTMINQQNKFLFETQHNLMDVELKNKLLQEESLKLELEQKNKVLSSHTLFLIQNNQLLENLRQTLQDIVKDDKRDHKKQLNQLIHQINQGLNNEQHWKEFSSMFESVHQRLIDNLKNYSSELTSNDFRLIALFKMNVSSKDMATSLGISQDSLRVARYRLRKKLNLSQGENLYAFLQSL